MSTLERINNYIKGSATLKLLGVAILALILLWPAGLVDSLIWERQNLRDTAVDEISSKWGNAQRLAGPIIQVPFTETTTTVLSDGKETSSTRRGAAYFLPEAVDFEGATISEERYRGIYVAVLYTADVKVSGHFKPFALDRLDVDTSALDWSRATLVFGLSDVRGIDKLSSLSFGSQSNEFEPGAPSFGLIPRGFQAPIELSPSFAGGEFSFDLNFRGSGTMAFAPLSAETNVSLNSDWGTPKFSGSFLPDERTIDDSGFGASWKILEVNRPIPQEGTIRTAQSDAYNTFGTRGFAEGNNRARAGNYDFGVRFLLPVDDYRKISRSAKYSALFIGATFLTFFFIEVLNRRRLHPVQYLLVGFAVVLFYVLLLSLSEHIGFNWAYLVSTGLILGLISGYTAAVLGNRKLTFLVTSILAILYGFFYSLLQLEDYSLLLGSAGLLLALATVMYLTRKTNWYKLQTSSEENQ